LENKKDSKEHVIKVEVDASKAIEAIDGMKETIEELALKKFEEVKNKVLKLAKETLGLTNWQLLVLSRIIVAPSDLDRARIWIKMLTMHDEGKMVLRLFRVRNAKITIVDMARNYFNYEGRIGGGPATTKVLGEKRDKYAVFKPNQKETLKDALVNDLRGLNLLIAHVGIIENDQVVNKWDELLEIKTT